MPKRLKFDKGKLPSLPTTGIINQDNPVREAALYLHLWVAISAYYVKIFCREIIAPGFPL
jgi:hypothetical protein